jgi:hypothetical protein
MNGWYSWRPSNLREEIFLVIEKPRLSSTRSAYQIEVMIYTPHHGEKYNIGKTIGFDGESKTMPKLRHVFNAVRSRKIARVFPAVAKEKWTAQFEQAANHCGNCFRCRSNTKGSYKCDDRFQGRFKKISLLSGEVFGCWDIFKPHARRTTPPPRTSTKQRQQRLVASSFRSNSSSSSSSSSSSKGDDNDEDEAAESLMSVTRVTITAGKGKGTQVCGLIINGDVAELRQEFLDADATFAEREKKRLKRRLEEEKIAQAKAKNRLEAQQKIQHEQAAQRKAQLGARLEVQQQARKKKKVQHTPSTDLANSTRSASLMNSVLSSSSSNAVLRAKKKKRTETAMISEDDASLKRKRDDKAPTSSSSSSFSASSRSNNVVTEMMAKQMQQMAEQMKSMQDALAKAQAENKKQKTEKKAMHSNDAIFPLTSDGKRKISVRTWSGRLQIDTREYYQKTADGEWLPGKKGVALKPEEFQRLVTWIPKIQEAIEERS